MMKNFTQGLIFGTIVGGLVALLNTPRSGEENRRRLQSYIQTNTDSVNELAESLKDLQGAVSRLSNEGMLVADTFSKEVTTSIEDFSQRNQPRIRRITDQVAKLSDTVEKETAKLQK